MSTPPRPRVRIACTLGPASSTPEVIRALVDAGLDVARLNLSHGTHEEHRLRVGHLRAAALAAGRTVAVLADLQGPKIRLGTFTGGAARLVTGAEFVITTEEVAGDARIASTTYPGLARDVAAGDVLLVDDGLVRLEAIASDGVRVRCRVVEGGRVSDHKGINLPGVKVSAPPLSPKDRADLRFVLDLGVDLVALSFVRDAADGAAVRDVMDEAGRRVPVYAKIEKPEAVAQLEAIADAFDGLLVARGDLGVELPLEQVPLVQKRVVRAARERAKPVMVATQLLESMVEHSRPTRAEVSDVAHTVLEGADSLLLTAETGVGRFPVAAVETLRRIALAAESESAPVAPDPTATPPVPRAVARAAARAAHDLGAAALVAFTRTGATARELAARREAIPLLAGSSDPAVRRQLAAVWGVETFLVPEVASTDDMVRLVDRALLDLGRAAPGELVVIVAGTPPGIPGGTNMLRVHRLGGA